MWLALYEIGWLEENTEIDRRRVAFQVVAGRNVTSGVRAAAGGVAAPPQITKRAPLSIDGPLIFNR